MAITEFAKQYHEKMFPGVESSLLKSDPEFIELFDNFAFDEVLHMPQLSEKPVDDHTRHLAILATLLGCQGMEEFRPMLTAAMNFGVTPVEIKEIVYQAVAYLGIGRVYPFLQLVNQVFVEQKITLPLPKQGTTDVQTRLEKGIEAQVSIFGDGMKEFYRSGPEETKHIHRWLAANCFGDYYTRTGLDEVQRELITFCFLFAQGGCEPQLISHAAANMRLGNDRLFLIQIVSHCLPFIGYPRCLNAIHCVDEAAKQVESAKAEKGE